MRDDRLEQGFLTVWAANKRRPMPRRNFRFHPTRRWELDFAWPGAKVAVELHGGVYQRGRHQRMRGFHNDRQKMRAAVMLGWRVLEYTTVDLTERPVQVCEEVATLLAESIARENANTLRR